MGNTTRSNLETQLSEALGDYQSLTSSAAGAATLTDADLADLAEDDDAIQGWVEITSGDADDDIRRIKNDGYVASTNIITVNNPFSSTPSSVSNYLLHRINPTLKRAAIGQAIRQLYPMLYNAIRDETIIVDNLLLNSGFETFDSGFTSWAEVGSPTVTAETTRVFHGATSAKIISAGGAVGQLTQAPDINMPEVAGKTASFRAWGWASAATNLRLRLDWDGVAFANGDYHVGDSSWRQLSVSAEVPTDATQVKCIVEVVAGTVTAYVDLSWLIILPIYKYTIPTPIINGPHKLEEQYDSQNPSGRYLPIPVNGSPSSGRLLRLQGMGQLTVPLSDTATTEVDGPRVDLIVAKAKEEYFKTEYARSEGNIFFLDQAREAARDGATLLRQPGVRMMALASEMPGDNWHTESDSSGRYIIFENNRNITVG